MKRIAPTLLGWLSILAAISCEEPKDDPIQVNSGISPTVLWHLPQGIRIALEPYTDFRFDFSRFSINLKGGMFMKVGEAESGGRLVKVDLPGMELTTKDAAFAIEFSNWQNLAVIGMADGAVLDVEDGTVRIKGKRLDTIVGKGVVCITQDERVLPWERPMFLISAHRLLFFDTITLAKVKEKLQGLYNVKVAFDDRFAKSELHNLDIDIRKPLLEQLPDFSAAGSFDFTLDSYNRILNIRPR